MDDLNYSDRPIAALLLAGGVGVIIWGLWLWHRPETVQQDTWLYWRIFSLVRWRLRVTSDEKLLTAREIRLYAVLTMVIGAIMAATGLISFLG